MSAEWYVFIDESGNDGMEFGQQGVSKYYVLAAIALRSCDADKAKRVFEETKAQHFKNATEMKSEFLGKRDDRRLSVTGALAMAPFELHLRVTDKQLLHSPGFQHARSFVKYLLGDIVGALLNKYENPAILCDHIKGPSFEGDVVKYLHGRYPQLLMRQWSFDFVDSKNNICVQAADLLAGIGRRCCQRCSQSPEGDQFLQLLSRQVSLGSFSRFPGPRVTATVDVIPDSLQSYDPALEMKAVSDAEKYVAQHMAVVDPAKEVLVQCVQELLKHNSLQGSLDWVPTRQLVTVCEVVLGEQVDPRRVRSFIGKLRDEGLLIASRRNPGGYKLPNRKADVVEFLNTQNEKIKPMMRRIQKARNALYGVFGIDILSDLSDAGFQNLLKLLPAVGTPADNI